MGKLTAPAIRARKVGEGAEPLVMVTAYDAPSARTVDESDADMILVGDSLGMVVQGHDNTLRVTVDDMVYHTGAVARARPAAHVVADMPWMSYHVSGEDAVRNAAALIRAGADAVKIEGGIERLPVIERVLSADIPVVGHIGLTPQSVNAIGGFKVQARQAGEVRRLVQAAEALSGAGCHAIVLECVPAQAAELVTAAADAPTIGIGAGPHCDGQVLVYHDLLGLEQRALPKFVRRYDDLHTRAVRALQRFAADVRSGAFPAEAESYRMPAAEAAALAGISGTDTGGPEAPEQTAASADR